jgi:glutamate dehydrogenase
LSNLALTSVLDETKPGHEQVLNKIKTRFREETFTRESIREVIQAHPELVRMLYINFAMTHCELQGPYRSELQLIM